MGEEVIRLEHISKAFHMTPVLKDVSLSLRAGEVHALVGENGAGKSTLTKILCGVYAKDQGAIYFSGRKEEFKSVADAQKLGIRMVYQELYLMNDLTVAQNIFIGREIKKGPFIDDGAMIRKTQELFDEYGIDISPAAPLKECSVAKMQMVEIIKNISRNVSVLVFDEPTTALSFKEVSDLFKMIEQIKKKGVAIVYISHKMEEILALADSISVLRDGELIGTIGKEEASRERIIKMMVGREIEVDAAPSEKPIEDLPVALKVNAIETNFLHDVSFSVHQGEIFGLAGLMGSGRTEVAKAIFGADKSKVLDLEVKGKKAIIKSPLDAIKEGICYLSEDRKQFGLMLDQSIYFNETISSIDSHAKFLFIDDKKGFSVAERYKEELSIKYSSLLDPIKNLSGGNQQKAIIARWLLKDTDIFIFDEPTKGIDILAKQEIYQRIRSLASSGKSIIVISSELEELFSLADRIGVMSEGSLVKIVSRKGATQEAIMEYALKRAKQ